MSGQSKKNKNDSKKPTAFSSKRRTSRTNDGTPLEDHEFGMEQGIPRTVSDVEQLEDVKKQLNNLERQTGLSAGELLKRIAALLAAGLVGGGAGYSAAARSNDVTARTPSPTKKPYLGEDPPYADEISAASQEFAGFLSDYLRQAENPRGPAIKPMGVLVTASVQRAVYEGGGGLGQDSSGGTRYFTPEIGFRGLTDQQIKEILKILQTPPTTSPTVPGNQTMHGNDTLWDYSNKTATTTGSFNTTTAPTVTWQNATGNSTDERPNNQTGSRRHLKKDN